MSEVNLEFGYVKVIRQQMLKLYGEGELLSLGDFSNIYMISWLDYEGKIADSKYDTRPRVVLKRSNDCILVFEEQGACKGDDKKLTALTNHLRTLLEFGKVSDIIELINDSPFVEFFVPESIELIKQEMKNALND